MIKANLRKIIIVLVTAIFVIISFNNHFNSQAEETIKVATTTMSESSKFIFVLKKGISYFASSSIPLIEGYATVSITDLNKISNYLTVSQVLLKIQSLVLMVTNLKLFKIIPLIFCIGLFFKSIKTIAFKLIIVSLLVCPGLSIYTSGVHGLLKSINGIHLGVDLHQKLKETRNTFLQKEDALKTHQQQVKDHQLAKAKAKGKDRIGFFKRAEDAVVNTVENVAVKVKMDVKLVEEVLLINTERLFIDLIKLLSNIILLGIILPLLYFYGINVTIKQLFQLNIAQDIQLLIEKKNLK